jgi:ABC-type glycerol-3-phosphate transport system substrate-binding protein
LEGSYINKLNGAHFLVSKKAITKIQAAILVIVIIAVVAGVAAYFLLQPKTLTIKIWHWTFTSESERQLWHELIENFSKKYPQYTVEIAEFSAGDLISKTTAALEAGTASAMPDIIHSTMPNLLWAKKGQLADLSDVASYVINKYGDDLVDMWKQGLLDTIPGPDGVRRRYWVSNGYALAGCLIVNLNLTEQGGVELNDLMTFEGLNASLYQLRDRFNELGLEARPLDFQISSSAPNDGTADFIMVFEALAGHPLYDLNGLHLSDADEEYVRATIELLARYYNDGILMEGALVEGEAENNVNFITGKCAMTGNAVASIIARLKSESPGTRAAVVPFAGRSGSVQARPFMVPAALPSERLEAAKTFLKWFFEKDNYRAFFGTSGGRGALDAPIYKSMLNQEPFLTDPVWSGVKSILNLKVPDPKWTSVGISMLASEGKLMGEVAAYITGGKTLEEATQAIVTAIRNAVQEWGS